MCRRWSPRTACCSSLTTRASFPAPTSRTGEIHWRERLGRGFSGSPVIGDGKVYIIDDDGNVHVIAVAKQYQLLGSNPLGEPSRSTPAIAGGRLYFRTLSHLVSVGGN